MRLVFWKYRAVRKEDFISCMAVRSSEVLTSMPGNTASKTFSNRLKKYAKQITLPSDDETYNVETTWTDLVEEDGLTQQRCKQQQGIFEFIQTERNYILKIRAVQIYRQIFILAKNNKKYEDLENIDSQNIFANINEIFITNDKIWTEYILVALERSRNSKEWINPCEILAAFEKTDELYKSYVDFCLQQQQCMHNIRAYSDTSNGTIITRDKSIDHFITFLDFCETLPHCNGWKLADLMIEPMKRMTLYPLLLKAILKRTECKEEEEFLKAMIVKFEQFVSHINTTIRRSEEDKKLQLCLDEFEECDVWLAGNEEVIWSAIGYLRDSIKLKEKSEQRCLLKRGPMKILESAKKKVDIEALLLSDVLVLVRQRKTNKKLTVVRQLYFLDKVILKKAELSSTGLVLIYLNEAGLLSESLMLDVSNSLRDQWIEKLEKVKKIYIELKKGCGTTLDIFKENSRTDPPESEADVEERLDNVHDQLKSNGYITNKKTSRWHLSKEGLKCVGNAYTIRKLSDQESKVSLMANTIRRALSDTNILEEKHLTDQTIPMSRSSSTKKKAKRKDSKMFNSLRERSHKPKDKVSVQKKYSFDSRSSLLSFSPLIRRISSNNSSVTDLKSLDDVFTDDMNNNKDNNLDSRDNSLDRRDSSLGSRDSSYPDDNVDDQNNSLDGRDNILDRDGNNSNSASPSIEKTLSSTVEIQTDISFGNWFFHKTQQLQTNSNNNNMNNNNKHNNNNNNNSNNRHQIKRTNSL